MDCIGASLLPLVEGVVLVGVGVIVGVVLTLVFEFKGSLHTGPGAGKLQEDKKDEDFYREKWQ